MKALVWHGKHNVSVENVPDPEILNPRDAIITVTTTCICGSDLHLYDGFIPTMEPGDILGHEFMGEVVEVGSRVEEPENGRPRRRPVHHRLRQLLLLQASSSGRSATTPTPTPGWPRKMYGHSPARACSAIRTCYGGYAGGQAEYVRVPFADVGPMKIPGWLTDEQGRLPDRHLPDRLHGGGELQHQPGDTVAVWGCGPVGQFAIRSAYLLGAEQVIAIDNIPERLRMAEQGQGRHASTCDDEYVYDKLQELTGGRGPDSCIDAVGMEAHGTTLDALYDRAKTATAAWRPTARTRCARRSTAAARAARSPSPASTAACSTSSPSAPPLSKGLTFKMGQTHVHKYLQAAAGPRRERRHRPALRHHAQTCR